MPVSTLAHAFKHKPVPPISSFSQIWDNLGVSKINKKIKILGIKELLCLLFHSKLAPKFSGFLLHALLWHQNFSRKAWNTLPGSIPSYFLAFLHLNSYLSPQVLSRSLDMSMSDHKEVFVLIRRPLHFPFPDRNLCSGDWQQQSPILGCGPTPYVHGYGFTFAGPPAASSLCSHNNH